MKNSILISLPLFLLLAVPLAGCGSTVALQSNAPVSEIIVDGIADEWQGSLTRIEKKNLSIGVQNDGDYLYLAVIFRDRQLINQMMLRGLTVWFDASGGEAKTFGLKFPIGLRSMGAQISARDVQNERSPDARREIFEASLRELEILESEDKGMRYAREAVQGLAVSATMNARTLVYELKIPLYSDASHTFAIDATRGGLIGVGLETPELERNTVGGQSGRGGRGGGRGGSRGGGGRGGSRGGGGRGGTGGGQQIPEALKLWTTIELAIDTTVFSPDSRPGS